VTRPDEKLSQEYAEMIVFPCSCKAGRNGLLANFLVVDDSDVALEVWEFSWLRVDLRNDIVTQTLSHPRDAALLLVAFLVLPPDG
jgi:hypothetical protein